MGIIFCDASICHIIGQRAGFALAGLRISSTVPEGVAGLLFETHWAYWIPLILAGVALAGFVRVGSQKLARQVGAVMVMIGVLWMVLAFLVVTPGERLWTAHEQILAAAQGRDAKGIVDLLAPDFHFGSLDRAEMAKGLGTTLGFFRPRSNTVRYFEATVNGLTAESRINVLTTLDGTGGMPGGPYLTKWQLEWVDLPGEGPQGGWHLSEIQRWFLSDGTNDTEMPAELTGSSVRF